MQNEPQDCCVDGCEAVEEEYGMCAEHLNDEFDFWAKVQGDWWPDFHDEYDLYGGEKSR